MILRNTVIRRNRMSEVKTYKCPRCSAPLIFDPEGGGMMCEYCDTKFSAEDMKEYVSSIEEENATDSYEWEAYTSKNGEWTEDEKSGMRTYVCPSCGGEVIGDENTVATTCPYCGNPTIMADNTENVYKPDIIIPFAFTKEQAKEALLKHYKGKWLLPKCFKDTNKIEEIKGIYVPFWFFDCDTDSIISYNATRVATWSDGDYIYTKTSHYLVRRGGKLSFENIPADGSSKIDDVVMQSIEPFDASGMIDFSANYLSGFFADKYDVDSEELMPVINDRVKRSVEDTFRSTVVGYNTVVTRSSKVDLSHGKIRYGFMPVWLLNTKYKEKLYTFAMNGQTGRLVGDLPVSMGRFFAFLGGIFAACTAIGTAILMLI